MRISKDDNVLINGLSLAHTLFRVIVMASLITLFYLGGYDEVELFSLTAIILPLTIFYLIAFFRFATKFPYSVSIRKISLPEFNTLLVVTIILYLVMTLTVLINPWSKDSLPTDNLKWVLLLCEIIHAIFAATKLANLFELREKPQEV